MGIAVIAILAEPPRPRLAFSELAETSPLSEAGAASLYVAMLKDACIAVERSSGDFLVNCRTKGKLPDEFAGDHDSETEIWSVVADVLGGTDSARFEPQVGSTFSTRAGNTASHLLNEEEEVHPAAVVRPVTPLLGRTHLDNAAMELRSTSIVLGPSTEDRVYFSGFLDPINFIDAYAEPEVGTLTCRTDDTGHNLDYIPMLPILEMDADLTTVVPMLRSRVESERLVPGHTATFVFEEGLRVEPADGVLELVRD